MQNQLTKKQKAALERDKNLAVTAGAGTGKTRVLVSRYLDLLLSGRIKISNILAITFTNKAAAEMLERVALELDHKLISALDESEKEKISEMRDWLSTAYISTIHAFCTRLLREYPLRLGLDPDFTVASEMQTEILLETAYHEEIDVLESEPDQWAELFRVLGANTIKKMLMTGAEHRYELDAVIKEYGQKDSELINQQLQSQYTEYLQSHIHEQTLQSLHNLTGEIVRQGLAEGTEDADDIFQLITAFEKTEDNRSLQYCVNLTNLVQRVTNREGNAYSTMRQLGGKNSWPDSDLLLKLSAAAAEIFPYLVTPPQELSHLLTRIMNGFYRLLDRFLHRYDQLKTQQGTLDFNDLLLLTLQLLADEAICGQLQRQFRYIMIDEFQDTNQLQWDIIRRLWENTHNNLFVVGDPKQSIYGFRNADVRVFKDLQNSFFTEHNSEIIQLDESFRFKENLAVFLNRIFSKILFEADEWSVAYQAISTKRDDCEGGGIEFALLQYDPVGDNQSAYICEKIDELIQSEEVSYSGIAVLLRTRNHLSDVEEMLRTYQIPFQTLGGIGFYQRQEIFDIYHLIRFLINPHDDIALVGLLRSPFAHLSDAGLFYLAVQKISRTYWELLQELENLDSFSETDRNNLQRFRERASAWLDRKDRISFYQLLEEIFYTSDYAAVLAGMWQGDRLLANIRKIANLAIEYEESGFLSLTDFAEFLHALIQREVQEGEAGLDFQAHNAVTIMTIHQAKGLEFPVVFVPYLEQKIRKSGSEGIYFDDKFGLAVTTKKGENHFLLDFVKKRRYARELAELKRVLYVACTRARDRLFISAGIKEKSVDPDTPLAWLLDALDLDETKTSEKNLPEGLNIRTSPPSERPLSGEQVRTRIKRLQKLIDRTLQPPAAETMSPGLRPAVDIPKFESFSATQILVYSRDQKEYERRYLLGFFEGDYDRLLPDAGDTDISLLRGKIMHRYLETYPDFDLERTLLEFEVADQRLQKELQGDLDIMAKRIGESIVLRSILKAQSYKNEVTVHMKLDQSYITGTIDRLYMNSDSVWEIVDYKSNHIGKQKVSVTTAEYQIQIEVYALLLAHLFPNQKDFCIHLYYTHPDVLDSIRFSKDDIRNLKEKYKKILGNIRAFHESVLSI